MSINTQLLWTLFWVGVAGATVSIYELWLRQFFRHHWRYAQLLTNPVIFPSYTGTGALYLGTLLSLGRDKLFWLTLIVSTVISQSLLVSPHWLALNSSTALLLPGLALTVAISSQVDQLTASFSQKHWPIPRPLVTASIFLAGLTAVIILSWLYHAVWLGLPVINTLALSLVTTAGFAAANLVKPELIGQKLAGLIVGTIRGVIFAVVVGILFNLSFELVYFVTLIVVLASLVGLSTKPRGRDQIKL